MPDGTAYGAFLRNLRGRTRPVAEMVMKAGEKSHVLNEAVLRNHRLRLRFLSFTKGHRPDVLDTNEFALHPNPLAESETNVEWTHVLGALKDDRYLLLVEKNVSGIWPTTLGRYLQWAIDEYYEPAEDEEPNRDREPVTINLESEPGPEFLERMEALDRVTGLPCVWCVRILAGAPKLNSGEGGESDAKRVDLTMTARRRVAQSARRHPRRIRDAFNRRGKLPPSRAARQSDRIVQHGETYKHAMLNMVDEWSDRRR